MTGSHPAAQIDPLKCYAPDAAAELMDVSPDTLYARIASGELVATNIAKAGAKKARWKIMAADILNYLQDPKRRNVIATSSEPTPKRAKQDGYKPRYL